MKRTDETHLLHGYIRGLPYSALCRILNGHPVAGLSTEYQEDGAMLVLPKGSLYKRSGFAVVVTYSYEAVKAYIAGGKAFMRSGDLLVVLFDGGTDVLERSSEGVILRKQQED